MNQREMKETIQDDSEVLARQGVPLASAGIDEDDTIPDPIPVTVADDGEV